MSSDSPEPAIKKSEDYAIVYSDDVMVNIQANVARIIFYRVEVQPTLHESEFTREPILQFEVRMPINALQNLQAILETLFTLQATLDTITIDESNKDSWNKFVMKMDEYIFTTAIGADSEKIRELRDLCDDIVQRSLRRGETRSGENK